MPLRFDFTHRKHVLLTLSIEENTTMGRKVAYWASTGVIAALMCFAAFSYLSGDPRRCRDLR